jgi:mRNA-degrading endonuclease HigB of HigAB toxin-antitoxin module
LIRGWASNEASQVCQGKLEHRVKGNRYRLIVDIIYPKRRIYIKYVLTHAEYDKDDWKNDPHF